MGPLALAVAATGVLAKQVIPSQLPVTSASVPAGFTNSANLHAKLFCDASTYMWRSLPLSRSSFSLCCFNESSNSEEPGEFSSKADSHVGDSDIPEPRPEAHRQPPSPALGSALSSSSDQGVEELSTSTRTNSDSAPWKEIDKQELVGDPGIIGNLQLQSSLATLSQTLAMMSETMKEVSAAVELVAKALDSATTSSSEAATLQASTKPASPPEPSNLQEIANGQLCENDKEERSRDQIPVYLTEQNARAHQLAYQLQQAFVQARIDGLGKPYQLAIDDFVTACMEAHAEGFGFKELQLQLILLEGALSGAFSVRAQWYSNDPLVDEENRIRSSWVHLVYATIAEVQERTQMGNQPTILPDGKEPLDPSEIFVKEVVTMALEKGYNLERLKLEQSVAGPPVSAGVRAMRQSNYVILLTLEKILSRG
ncbi:hypothetical protein CY35_07G092700 [Sphagnum magellanicum]|uniref:Uncharacterized protein n=2 Tax=Sphagnum magellanicum TaxID=128215 RepID=A0ACB8HN61_9BRYO|nr:hypothetical protein CY35_07G092700 [Sphagnum magellanicum]